MTKPISRDEAARLLKGLSNPYAVRRREDAKALARVTESNKQMVAALLALANNDPDFKVREAATVTLNAPVHQPFVLDLQAEATAKQVPQRPEQEILSPAAEHSSAAQEESVAEFTAQAA